MKIERWTSYNDVTITILDSYYDDDSTHSNICKQLGDSNAVMVASICIGCLRDWVLRDWALDHTLAIRIIFHNNRFIEFAMHVL